MKQYFLALGGALVLAACNPQSPDQQQATTAATEKQTTMTGSKDASGLEIVELATGSGPAIEPGNIAVVHYTGWLYDETREDHKGAKFDSSRDRGEEFRFPLGAGMVIKGWDQGVAGMRVGDRRLLIIPAALGYGSRGAGGLIPPGATLVFDVELLGIE